MMSEPTAPVFVPPLERISSGVSGLDTVLFGGFIKNGLYIIQGAPGAGKTILSNQICYAFAASGGRALYVTLLSEQHERLLANLEQMSFFDAARIAHEISYVSAFQLLERDGLSGLLTLLRREIVAHRAGMLIIDGLVAAEAYASTDLELKKFVHELQTLAAAADCTMFLLTSSGLDTIIAGVRPEHTMVDGLISLHDSENGWRVERDLFVSKFRGSDHLRGRHAMCITADGIKVWPRVESLPLPSKRLLRDKAAPRLSTGVSGLDAMLEGGLPTASSSVVLGPSGAGKTALGLQFLAACTAEEPGLLLGFYETPERLLARAEDIASHLPDLVEQGIVRFQWHGAAEGLMDEVATNLLHAVRAYKIRRLVIDSLQGFEDMTVQPDRMTLFYRALTSQLRELGVTTLSTMEVRELTGPVARAPLTRLTPIAENLILLRHVEELGQLQRLVSVMKLRDGAFDMRVRRFSIGPGGIVLDEADTSGPPTNASPIARKAEPRA
jgi:circadian clock protein KaiC